VEAVTLALPAEGGCQCGGCRYRISCEPLRMAMCFCQECQRGSGSAFGLSVIVKKTDFDLFKGQSKSWTRIADSGRTVDQHFCPDCGCRLFHVPTWQDGVLNVRAGTLDDTTAFAPTLAVWTKRQAAWLSVSGLEGSFDTVTGSSPLTAGKEPAGQ
jgi:hypothetical protein